MKTVDLQYGNQKVPVDLPDSTAVRGMRASPEPISGQDAIPAALRNPIGTPPLEEIARTRLSESPGAEAVIVVSDNTRPVPYRGEDGLMIPIVETLRRAGFADAQITVIVGAGSHRNMTADEIEEMLGLEAFGMGGVEVLNHEYANSDHLKYLGETDHGTPVYVNNRYVEADLKIVTGLVESHFMAGASGGRKGICPGIVGEETLTSFHGAGLLSSEHAEDLKLDDNPLHHESREAASMAGWDFLANVTINTDKRLTGVFAGDLDRAHEAAVEKIREYVVVEIDRDYDVVVVPGSFVGVNHYQAAKAAVEGARAVRKGGIVIVIANNTDPDPVGGAGYKDALRLLDEHGVEGFMDLITRSDWNLIQEQWQVQMWCKVLRKIEREDHLIYGSLQIPEEEYEILPGQAAFRFLTEKERSNLDEVEAVRRMTTRSVARALEMSPDPDPSVLFLEDGPYGIPERTGDVKTGPVS